MKFPKLLKLSVCLSIFLNQMVLGAELYAVQADTIESNLSETSNPVIAFVNSINGRGLHKMGMPSTPVQEPPIDNQLLSEVLTYVHTPNAVQGTEGFTQSGDLTSELPGTFTFDLGEQKDVSGIVYWRAQNASLSGFRVWVNDDPNRSNLADASKVLPESSVGSNDLFTPNLLPDPPGSQTVPARFLPFKNSEARRGRYVHLQNFSRRSSAIGLGEFAFVVSVASDNANLASLAVTGNELIPVFSTAATSYDCLVPNDATTVMVEATSEDDRASMLLRYVGGDTIPLGSGKWPVTLSQEGNGTTLELVVTAADETAPPKLHTIRLYRKPALGANPGSTVEAGIARLSGNIISLGDGQLQSRGFAYSSQNPDPQRGGEFVTEAEVLELPAIGTFQATLGVIPREVEYTYRSYAVYRIGSLTQDFTLASNLGTFTVPSDDSKLSGLFLNDEDSLNFSPAIETYSFTVPSDASGIDFSPMLNSDSSKITNIRIPLTPDGAFVITVQAADLTTTDYTVTVNREPVLTPANTTYSNWATLHYPDVFTDDGNFTNDGNASPNATPKEDGVSNLLRYAMGLTALEPIPAGALPQAFTTVDGNLQLKYRRSNLAADVAYTVQMAGDLTDFVGEPPAFEIVESVVSVPGNGYEMITAQTQGDVSAPPQLFLRLKVELKP